MLLGLLTDTILTSMYNLPPYITRKIYELVILLEPHFESSSLKIILDCITGACILEKDFEYRKVYLIVDELYTRIQNVGYDDRYRQICMLKNGEISFRDIGKKRTNITVIAIYTCLSCGNKADYDELNRKYVCEGCCIDYPL